MCIGACVPKQRHAGQQILCVSGFFRLVRLGESSASRMARYAFQMVNPIKDGKMSQMANPANLKGYLQGRVSDPTFLSHLSVPSI